MRRGDSFAGLSVFLAVARRKSFRAAAAELQLTRAAVSLAVKGLEKRIGQPLFQRTTRSVALTDAGAELLAAVEPAASEIGLAVERAANSDGGVRGQLRLSVPRIAVDLVVAPVLPEFRRAHPDVTVEIDVDDTSVDLSERRYDAGIRIGEWLARDMVAVRLTRGFRWMVVGSPDYFARRGRPHVPQDLMAHECIRYRFPTATSLYRWEFARDGAAITIDPPGSIIVNDHLTMVTLARLGTGLAYTADLVVAAALKAGELKPVLQDYLSQRQGLFLYFPANTQRQPKLRAFIDVARRALRGGR